MKIKIKFSTGNAISYIDGEIPSLSKALAQAELERLLPGNKFVGFVLAPEEQAMGPTPVKVDPPTIEFKRKPVLKDEPK